MQKSDINKINEQSIELRNGQIAQFINDRQQTREGGVGNHQQVQSLVILTHEDKVKRIVTLEKTKLSVFPLLLSQ